jgi:hypothetical protein
MNDASIKTQNKGGASASPNLPLVVTEWPKNSRETVRISLAQYKGKNILDCRVWYDANDGELKPSPKGLAVEIRHLQAMVSGITQALRQANAMGLLEGGGS